MNSQKDIIYNKIFTSDIFNQKENKNYIQVKPKAVSNRSSLARTKEEVFNIGKAKRINRKINKQNLERQISMNSGEERIRALNKLYGSDIFNQKSVSILERRRGKRRSARSTERNYSSCFEEMKNNDEYKKDLLFYTKQHRCAKKVYSPSFIEELSPSERYRRFFYGNKDESIINNGGNNKSEGTIEESKLNYIKNRMEINKNPELSEEETIGKKKGKNSIKVIRLLKRNRLNNNNDGKRRFVDRNEFPRNNSKINKQIQFESHIFSNHDKFSEKSNEEIKEINDRIERTKKNNANIIGHPLIKVNRNKKLVPHLSSNTNIKLSPADIEWSSPKAEVLFGKDHSIDIYKRFGPKGPTAYQLQLYQFADSENMDTLSGLSKMKFENMERPKKEEKINEEISKKIEKIVGDLENINEGKKIEIKMRTSILDFKDENELNNKGKVLKEFYKKGKNKNRTRNREISDKIGNVGKTTNYDRDCGYHEYKIIYSNKNNRIEKFDDIEIKKMFGKKGINIYDINKDPFNKNIYNTIRLKIVGNDNNNEIQKKLKKVEEELNNKDYKIKIEKEVDTPLKRNHKRIINSPSGRMGIMPDPFISYDFEEAHLKVMPTDYKKRKGFTKEFNINYKYKKFNK